MEASLFMLGSLAFLGLLVACAMRAFTESAREVGREEEAQRRLAELEAEEERLRKAAA